MDPSWSTIVAQLGVSGVVLIGVWKSLVWLGENAVKPLVSSHSALINQLQKSDGEKTELLSVLANNQREMSANSARTDQEILQTQREMLSLMKGK